MPATPPPMTVTDFGFGLECRPRSPQTSLAMTNCAQMPYGRGYSSFCGSWDAEARRRKDIVVCAVDAFEQAVVDRDQYPEGGAAFAIDEREQGVGGAVVAFGTSGVVGQKGALVARWAGRSDCGAGANRRGYVVGGEIFEGEIDAVACGVFLHVAEDVGELEGDAGFFGEFFGAGIGVAEDADADQADDGGDEVAVVIEVGEGGVGVGRVFDSGARSVQASHRDPWRRRRPVRREG